MNSIRPMSKKCLLFQLIISGFLAMSFWSCSKGGPPEAIVEEARRHTVQIMEDYRAEPGGFEGNISLKREYYDSDKQRYVLEYQIDTKFTSPLPETPTAYITKKDQNWYYEFRFDRKYEFGLTGDQDRSMN